MVQTIGAELEFSFVDAKERKPVDTLAHLGGSSRKTGKPFEELTTDMAASSGEMVTTPCTSGAEIGESLARIKTLFPKDLVPLFKTRPFPGEVALAQKSRMFAMQQALEREQVGGGRGVNLVGQHNSLQFHLGVKDIRSPEAVLFQNLLNNSAPYSRLQVNRRYEITDAVGHLMCWQGWTNESRVPSPRWFANFDALESFIAKIPKLVTLKDGEWVVAENMNSTFGDPESEGTLWWTARFRAVFSTIEWRPFSSMDPSQVPEVVDEVLKLARAYWKALNRWHGAVHGIREDLNGLYRELHEQSWLAPPAKIENAEWWRLYRL